MNGKQAAAERPVAVNPQAISEWRDDIRTFYRRFVRDLQHLASVLESAAQDAPSHVTAQANVSTTRTAVATNNVKPIVSPAPAAPPATPPIPQTTVATSAVSPVQPRTNQTLYEAPQGNSASDGLEDSQDRLANLKRQLAAKLSNQPPAS